MPVFFFIYVCFYSLRCLHRKKNTINVQLKKWFFVVFSRSSSSFFCFPKVVKNPVSEMLFGLLRGFQSLHFFHLFQRHLCARIRISYSKVIKTCAPYSKIGWKVKRNHAISFKFFFSFVRLLFADIQHTRILNGHHLKCVQNGLKGQSLCLLWWNLTKQCSGFGLMLKYIKYIARTSASQ